MHYNSLKDKLFAISSRPLNFHKISNCKNFLFQKSLEYNFRGGNKIFKPIYIRPKLIKPTEKSLFLRPLPGYSRAITKVKSYSGGLLANLIDIQKFRRERTNLRLV